MKRKTTTTDKFVTHRPELRQIQSKVEIPLIEALDRLLKKKKLTKADWFRAVIRRELAEAGEPTI